MKKILLVAIALAVLLAAGFWWRQRAAAAPEADDAKPVAPVKVAPLARESIGRALTAYGVVEPSAGATAVSLGYDCVVQSVAAPVGARVAAGEALARVVPTPDAQLQIDSARGAAQLAGRTLASLRQRHDLQLATDDDLRAAEQAAQDAELKVASLTRRGLGAAGGLIAAPLAGIVVKLDAQPGATVPAGTALVVIAGSQQLQARLGLEPSEAGRVKAGQPVRLSAVNRPDAEPVTAAIGAVGAAADAGTGSLDARVPLPAGADWFPGERVQAEIEVERKDALVVPRGAVLPDDDQEVLYTVKGGKAVKHAVQIGIAAGEKVEVSGAGLVAGDAVVVEGNYELADGMDVQVGDPAAATEAKPEDQR